jgi:hypothetical protein
VLKVALAFRATIPAERLKADPELSMLADKPEVCMSFYEVLSGLKLLAYSGQCGWVLRVVFLVHPYSVLKANILRPCDIGYPIVRKFTFIYLCQVSEDCKR